MPPPETYPLRSESDVLTVRQAVRAFAVQAGMGVVDQTKVVTAVSELARNTLVHGGGGLARVELVVAGPRKGVRASFEDQGKGIPDLDLAMKDGFTTGGGMGLGLGGAKRLVNEFEIHSRPGEGTRVTIVRWK